MKQTAGFISTYTADVSGICSALYELGGMTVMHDASGCNSTYHTHDEPRWYDMDSMVFISALSEMEAIMGDDDKLIHDITEAALDLHPKFIAIAGTPIPTMIGTDLAAIAAVIEANTGIRCFGFPTTGMHSYIHGVSMALNRMALAFADRSLPRTTVPSVNILGATPLDFSINGTIESIRSEVKRAGFDVISTWAMGSTLEELSKAGSAQVNLVISSSGMETAKTLQSMFHTPYIVGTMSGPHGIAKTMEALYQAIQDGNDRICYQPSDKTKSSEEFITLIGEIVTTASLAVEIEQTYGRSTRILCPLETYPELLRPQDIFCMEEDDFMLQLAHAKTVIADPLYAPICPKQTEFISLPHEAYSGRMYRDQIPNLTSDFHRWSTKVLTKNKK